MLIDFLCIYLFTGLIHFPLEFLYHLTQACSLDLAGLQITDNLASNSRAAGAKSSLKGQELGVAFVQFYFIMVD